jgi:Flp pilus assembly protein TadD
LLEDAVQHTPDDPKLWETLIRAYMAGHDLNAARREAEGLKALRPNEPTGYQLAGLIAHDQNRPDDSEKNLEHAYQLQPDSFEILTSLTRFSLERHRDAAAIERLQRALGRDPNDAQVLDLLGGTYLETGDLVHAQGVLSHAIVIAPRSWPAYRDLAQVKLVGGDSSGAIEEYQKALQFAPSEPRLVTELASLYEKLGRIDEAISLYETLLHQDPNAQQLAANNLAMLLVSYRSDAASLDRARALTSQFDLSDNASLLDTNGWVHFKRREYQDAVAVLERAADRSPDSKVIRTHLDMARSALANLKAPRTG